VESSRKKFDEDQLKFGKLQAEAIVMRVNLKRVQDELKNYTAAGNNQDRKKSYKFAN